MSAHQLTTEGRSRLTRGDVHDARREDYVAFVGNETSVLDSSHSGWAVRLWHRKLPRPYLQAMVELSYRGPASAILYQSQSGQSAQARNLLFLGLRITTVVDSFQEMEAMTLVARVYLGQQARSSHNSLPEKPLSAARACADCGENLLAEEDPKDQSGWRS